MILRLIILFSLITGCTQAQTTFKDFFTKDGRYTDERTSVYYQTGKKQIIETELLGKVVNDTILVDTVKTFYTSTNQIRSRIFYKEGRKEGRYTVYHSNGRIEEKGTYYQNKKVGYITSWYENGAVESNLKYFMSRPGSYPIDSLQIINYWDKSNQQLVKDGFGYCKCYIGYDTLLQQGKVVKGYPDSTWIFTYHDTVKFQEEFKAGKFINGSAFYDGTSSEYKQFEKQAEMPGGMVAMMKFLAKNIRYPLEAKRMGVEGKVFVKFVVAKDGTISSLQVIKGVSRDLDKEAVRVIGLSDKWLPARIKGVPVKSTFVLPVYFKLDY